MDISSVSMDISHVGGQYYKVLSFDEWRHCVETKFRLHEDHVAIQKEEEPMNQRNKKGIFKQQTRFFPATDVMKEH